MVMSSTSASDGDERAWTYYALATLFGAFLVFLYGPMLVIYILSFQGPEGGVTFPMVGTSISWFVNIFEKDTGILAICPGSKMFTNQTMGGPTTGNVSPPSCPW